MITRRPKPANTAATTMVIPAGTEVEVDNRGQLSIRTPGNLVIQSSGRYGVLESLSGSIRIEPGAAVEAVHVRCPGGCFIQGELTAWKVSAREIHLDSGARASILLQEAEQVDIGRRSRLVGNFGSEQELYRLFSRFAQQVRSLPLFEGTHPVNPDGAHEEIVAEAEVVFEEERDPGV